VSRNLACAVKSLRHSHSFLFTARQLVCLRDPQVQKEFANTLYDNGAAIFSEGLRPNGVLVAQVGEANTIHSPSSEFSIDKARSKFIENLVALGVKAVRIYEESHNGFFSPWEFVVAFNEPTSVSEWFSNSAEINLKIRKRSMDALGGGSLFLHFDGATMESFRFPSKGSEVSFCRERHSSRDCVAGRGLNSQGLNLSLASSAREARNTFILHEVRNEQSSVPGAVKTDIERNNNHGWKVSPHVAIGFRTAALIRCLTEVVPSFWKDMLNASTVGNDGFSFFEVSLRQHCLESMTSHVG
jgi:hypothetical protein